MAGKHAILVLEYVDEPKDSRDKILKEAHFIEKKLLAKQDTTAKVFETQHAFGDWMSGDDSRGLTKIHIVSHGNWEEVGRYNGAGLADYIRAHIRGKRDLRSITIHSCFSGAKHPKKDEILVQQFASRLLTHLKSDFSQYIVVRGYDGASFTDTEGRNWSLNEGVTIPDYRTREREVVFTTSSTKPRLMARPKFAISNTPGYRGVDAV